MNSSLTIEHRIAKMAHQEHEARVLSRVDSAMQALVAAVDDKMSAQYAAAKAELNASVSAIFWREMQS